MHKENVVIMDNKDNHAFLEALSKKYIMKKIQNPLLKPPLNRLSLMSQQLEKQSPM